MGRIVSLSIYESVGRRIRQARRERDLLQADLGRMLARPRSHAAISDIERGKTHLSLQDLVDIALLLDKPLSFFMESIQTEPPIAAHLTKRVWELNEETARLLHALTESQAREAVMRTTLSSIATSCSWWRHAESSSRDPDAFMWDLQRRADAALDTLDRGKS